MRLAKLWIPKWAEDQLTTLNDILEKIRKMFNNRLEFEDNMYVDFVNVNTTGGTGSSYTIEHDLGKAPTGWIVTCSLCGTVFGSGGAWDEDEVILNQIIPDASGDSVDIMLF